MNLYQAREFPLGLPGLGGLDPRTCEAWALMPWLIGEETSVRVQEALPEGLLLSPPFSVLGGSERQPAYVGYLCEGFSADLAAGRFLPERVPLAIRAGWNAVAVTARTPDETLARRLGPFLAPTAPRPHIRAPLGFTLFSVPWLSQALKDSALPHPIDTLCWAAQMSALICARQPVFCDPVLELALSHRTAGEESACRYRAPGLFRGSAQALNALLFPGSHQCSAPPRSGAP